MKTKPMLLSAPPMIFAPVVLPVILKKNPNNPFSQRTAETTGYQN
jgi:hypothetical protein